MVVKTATVIGATGTMGANIAGVFAAFGNARVYCVGRSIEKVTRTIPRIIQSAKGKDIASNLYPADYSMVEKCVSESDIVFESVSEDILLKKDIARQVASFLPSNAVSCTGTSGLSVNEIALCYPEDIRGNFFGVHLFNPPYSVSLCELIPSAYSDEKIKASLREYLEIKLHRTVVDVKDSPAFLGNRIGFQFINEALQFAEKYKDRGGLDYIDAILGSFTGRVMPPLKTIDFVGLDVHKAIVDNIYANTRDFAHRTFILPEFAQRLFSERRFGRKSGEGLYRMVAEGAGQKRQAVLDINTGEYRDIRVYDFSFATIMKSSIAEGNYKKAFEALVKSRSQEAKICRHFLLSHIVYSLYITKEVGYTIKAADDVMAAGFNWCPPLALYQALSEATDVRALIKEQLPELHRIINIDALLSEVTRSDYDYRAFFK